MSTLYFPVTITSARRSIKLSDSAHLIRVDNPRIKNVIGIRHVALTESGHIREIGHNDNAPWYTWVKYLRGHNPTHNIGVSQTNFVLSVASKREAILVGFAMKLLSGTRSGPYFGFSDMKKSPFTVELLALCPYWGGNFLTLERKEISMLRRLLKALKSFTADEKLDTIIEKYRYAESATVPSVTLRFLELAVILEMLFLPKEASELSYRFQLRIAKWFGRHYREDVRAVATQAKRIYDIRSAIVHKGTPKAKISDEDLGSIRRLARMSLHKFVLERSLFEDNYLEELCLLG